MVRQWMTRAGSALALIWSAAAVVLAQEPQGQFLPVTPGQMQEPIPAAPLVFTAYGFVWVALAAYVILLWRRLSKVERELSDVNARLQASRRG